MQVDPYVPEDALNKPAGAVVNHGHVTCVACQQSVALANADIVGLGYRCAPCSRKAEIALLTGRGDAGAHFTSNERAGLAASGVALVMAGIGVMILGALIIPLGRIKLGGGVIVGGVTLIATGFARRGAARG